MRYIEALLLKPGDLVIYSNSKKYDGLIFEIENIDVRNEFDCFATLKQPGFDTHFRLKNINIRRLKRYKV